MEPTQPSPRGFWYKSQNEEWGGGYDWHPDDKVVVS
jgi:hypothetical protein